MCKLIHALSDESLYQVENFLIDWDFIRGLGGMTRAKRVLEGVSFVRRFPTRSERDRERRRLRQNLRRRGRKDARLRN